MERQARLQKQLEAANKTVQYYQLPPAEVRDAVSGPRIGKPKDKGQVLEDNFQRPPSDKVAKPLGKSSAKGGLGSESLYGILTPSASGDESKKELLRGWHNGVQVADDKRRAEATARAKEQARTGTKPEPEQVTFKETWKKVETGSGEQRKVVGVEKGNLKSGAGS